MEISSAGSVYSAYSQPPVQVSKPPKPPEPVTPPGGNVENRQPPAEPSPPKGSVNIVV